MGLQQPQLSRAGPLPRLSRLHALLRGELRRHRLGGGRPRARLGLARRDEPRAASRGAVRRERARAELVGSGRRQRRRGGAGDARLRRERHRAGRVWRRGVSDCVARRRGRSLVRQRGGRLVPPPDGGRGRGGGEDGLPAEQRLLDQLRPLRLAVDRLHGRAGYDVAARTRGRARPEPATGRAGRPWGQDPGHARERLLLWLLGRHRHRNHVRRGGRHRRGAPIARGGRSPRAAAWGGRRLAPSGLIVAATLAGAGAFAVTLTLAITVTAAAAAAAVAAVAVDPPRGERGGGQRGLGTPPAARRQPA
mmetsp:Transcript_28379/g.83480  ORF Transcript_28379/g.83480 Transcript_28379/m.83480 type:complete len:307 (-) Transcript_28379:865-1785(-)